MNTAAITKEELLDAAQRIAADQGLEALSIRRVAAECGISVGCIYNYFPSKSQLTLALMERFWAGAFHRGLEGCAPGEDTRFPDFVEEAYRRLARGLEGFSAKFLSQASLLSQEERARGKAREEDIHDHMRAGLLQILERDRAVPPEVWNGGLTPRGLADFTFRAMMDGLRRGEPDCSLLAELLRRSLYPACGRDAVTR